MTNKTKCKFKWHGMAVLIIFNPCVTMSPFRSVASSSRRTGALGGGRNREPMIAFLMALAIGPCARNPKTPSNVTVGGHNTSPCLLGSIHAGVEFC